MRKLPALRVFAITAVLLLPACGAKKPERVPLAADALARADEQGLNPRTYQKSLGSARTEKFVAMYRLLGETEVRASELEQRLGAAELELAELRGEAPPPHLASRPTSKPDDEGTAVGAPVESPVPGEIGNQEAQQMVVAALREELLSERAKRDNLQQELDHLRTEASSGPFERGSDPALTAARKEINGLKLALHQESRTREELRKRYEALRAATRKKGGNAAVAAENAALRGEISQLKQRQNDGLDSINRDLKASRKHEEELQAALVRAQTAGEQAPKAGQLSKENETLRAEVEQQRQRNKTLQAKLKVAMRVSDLIFRMQGQKSTP